MNKEGKSKRKDKNKEDNDDDDGDEEGGIFDTIMGYIGKMFGKE